MFDELKSEIRNEIGNERTHDINDKVATKLAEIAAQAKEQNNFEKNIACHEIILEDLGINNPNAFGEKTVLLSEYNDCGYYDTTEALNLALNLLNEINKSDENLILPTVHVPAIKPLYCSNDNEFKNLAKQCALSSFKTCLNLVNNFGNNDFNISQLNLALRELVRIYIYENKFEEAYDLLLSIPSNLINSIDIVARCYLSIIELYGLGGDDKYSSQSLEELKQMTKIPEANYILGIVYAEGYKVEKNLTTAKSYFEKAKNLENMYKGKVGYTNYEFSVLSKTPLDHILNKAQRNEYHSKFYIAKQDLIAKQNFKAKQNLNSKGTRSNSTSKVATKTTTSTTQESSGGCYVATCVYGSYDCPPVWTLRRFRDNFLSRSIFGRWFIKLYYAISPTAVRLFGNKMWFHKLFKTPLDKLVKKLQEIGVESTPYDD